MLERTFNAVIMNSSQLSCCKSKTVAGLSVEFMAARLAVFCL